MLTPLAQTLSCHYRNRSLDMHGGEASLLHSSYIRRMTVWQLYSASCAYLGAYVSCDALDLA